MHFELAAVVEVAIVTVKKKNDNSGNSGFEMGASVLPSSQPSVVAGLD